MKPRRRTRGAARPAAEAVVDFQTVAVTAPLSEPVATRPRRRPRVVKPAVDEVDFQIAPIAEPVGDTRPRRRTRAAAKPRTEAVASVPASAEDGAAPAKPRRRRASAAVKTESAPVSEAVAGEDTAPAKARRRRPRATTAAAAETAEG